MDEMMTTTHCDWQKVHDAGDAEAYGRLFKNSRSRALKYVYQHMDPALAAKVSAEDIVQDASLHAHKCFDTFEYTTKGAFGKWFCEIIDNVLLDHMKALHRAKRQEVPLPPRRQKDPVAEADKNDKLRQARERMERLPKDQRDAVNYRYFEHLTIEETAEKMGKSFDTIWRLTVHGLLAMRRMGHEHP